MSKEAVEKVIIDAYIRGIHETQDEKTIRRGFHEDFYMYVREGETVQKVNIAEWLRRIEGMKRQNPELWKGKTEYTFKFVDITGDTACIKIEVYKNDTFFSTDYMLLFKFKDGWKIVSKVFQIPQ
ncbi:MAG: nuclear transport factor 2 family protein [Theionarchaea archaeon]|nr:nuclear transport factor 2 family protein [Theionarchaea archaeon]MBU7037475.1 nuclear transport factor 2 family protein [Theionarchaea archaeon]